MHCTAEIDSSWPYAVKQNIWRFILILNSHINNYYGSSIRGIISEGIEKNKMPQKNPKIYKTKQKKKEWIKG